MLLRGKLNTEGVLGRDYPTRTPPATHTERQRDPPPSVLPSTQAREDVELCVTTFAPNLCQGSRLGAVRTLTGNVEVLGLLPLGKSLQSLQHLHHGVLAAQCQPFLP